MSRSKRAPYWTEGYKGNHRKRAKRAANKRVRSSLDDSDGKQYKKRYNSWDIVDFKIKDEKNWKARRK